MKPFQENIKIPTLQVRENCVVYYELSEFRGVKKEQGFKKTTYGGQVTRGVQKRIGRAVDIFLQTTENRRVYNTVTGRTMDFRLNFITLTIPDLCRWTGDECYTKLMKPFLRVMKNKYGLKKYLWKYELQGRGNVHYHLTTDTFIEHSKIRQAWNGIIKKNGLSDIYALKHLHFNPNSTDVHKTYKIKNVAAYLSKYLSKSNERVCLAHEGFPGVMYDRYVKGKVWDCSQDLKRSRFSSTVTDENWERVVALETQGKAKIIGMDNCTIIKCETPTEILTEAQKIMYEIWKCN